MNKTISRIMTSLDSDISDLLNSDSVMEALCALAEETERDRLFARFLQIILAKTGIYRGALLVPEDKHWSIAIKNEGSKIERVSPISLQESQIVPQSVIQWVARAQLSLISDNLPARANIEADSYFQIDRPLFFAGLPLLYQKSLKGIIYLESRERKLKFSQQQLKALNFLCLQAAIILNRIDLSDLASNDKTESQEQRGEYIGTLEEQLAESQAELKEARSQLIAREKLATLGLLSAGVAHEIRNPLNFVTNCSETSEELVEELLENLEKQRDRIPPADFSYFQEMLTDVKNNAAIVRQQGQRVEGIIRSMMQHARSEQNAHHPTDINQLLDRAALLAYHSRKASKKGIHINIQTQYDNSVGLIDVAEGDLSRAFINLIDNACYALETKYKTGNQEEEAPTLWLTTENQAKATVIRIRDNGEGIPADIKNKLFTPFFTTKPIGEGTGLGLFLTRNIVIEQHQGKLDIESEFGQYAEFIITLPKP
ncbi:MAG: GAF domain-containing sensor histidine kinase [Cyanobacteria bacterium SBLK]|nr:GAF domain-containing sensor histidine kinase [Cyanobacteria bacterium SBLK]